MGPGGLERLRSTRYPVPGVAERRKAWLSGAGAARQSQCLHCTRQPFQAGGRSNAVSGSVARSGPDSYCQARD